MRPNSFQKIVHKNQPNKPISPSLQQTAKNNPAATVTQKAPQPTSLDVSSTDASATPNTGGNNDNNTNKNLITSQDGGNGDQKLPVLQSPKRSIVAHSLQSGGDGTSNQNIATQISQPQTDAGSDSLGVWMSGMLGGGTPFSSAQPSIQFAS